MRPADQLDEPPSPRVLGSRRADNSAQPALALLVPPPAGARGRMAGCESRRGVSVHPATANFSAERVAGGRGGVQPSCLSAARAQYLLDLSLYLLQVHELPGEPGVTGL